MNKEWSDKNKLAQIKLKKTSFQEGINEYIELREAVKISVYQNDKSELVLLR